MALINFMLLVPLVYFIPDLIRPFLPANKLVQVVGTVAAIVPIISYIAMPITMFIRMRYLSRTETKQHK
jgi:antibiotic biosynthesis monooxygenase (ABM) superfamily enzyme